MSEIKKEIPFLQEVYNTKVVPFLQKEYNITNPHLIPKVEKVIINMRFGKDKGDKKAIEAAISELALITGRKPAISKAKKSIAGFELREGMISGAYCTLRGAACYHFLERLIYMSLPRLKDFRGFKMTSFDRHNNFAIGIKEHLIFNELSYDKVNKIRGLDVMIVIKNSTSPQMSYDLLKLFNFPIKKN